ncbi:hypothetical protein LCGC14_2465760, partial [marine sediment metagenome]
ERVSNPFDLIICVDIGNYCDKLSM